MTKFHIDLNGVDVSGPISVPDTGSWQQLKLITHENVKIEKTGPQLMKVIMKREGPSKSIADIDYYKFVKRSP